MRGDAASRPSVPALLAALVLFAVLLTMFPRAAPGVAPTLAGKLPFQSCPVVDGVAKDNFGFARNDHPHYGVDILAPMGSPILAPFPGVLTNLKKSSGGLKIMLTRKNGSFALGYHLSKHVRPRRVVVGDVIGYVGKTAKLTSSPHLHLEWHPRGGEAKDSFPFLEALDCARFVQYAPGATHTCGLVSDGRVTCWGLNTYGQLGDGTIIDSYGIVPTVGISGATQVVSGDEFSCAIPEDASVQCWGRNDLGQLGDGTFDDSNVPVPVVGVSGVSQISAGDTYACAVLPDATETCWGQVPTPA